MTNENKKLEKERRSKKITEDIRNEKEILIHDNDDEYKYTSKEQKDLGKIKDTLINYKSKIVGEGFKSNSHPRISQMKRQIENSNFWNSQLISQSYKLVKDGRYGNLTIDLNQQKGFNKLGF